MLAPEVVSVDLTSERVQSGDGLPFAPAGDPTVTEANRGRSLITLAAAFRWRRQLMIVLAVAVAGSVALASQRNSSVDSDGRTSGAMSGGPATDGEPTGSEGGAAVVASEASGNTGLRAQAEATGAEGEPTESSDDGAVPLQVVTPSTSTTVDGGTAQSRRSATSGSTAGRANTTAGAVTSTAGSSAAPSTEGAGSDTTAGQSTTARPATARQASTSTERAATTERATTTTAATTTQRPTTTERTTTTRRTTTTVVLVGRSAGGFESPSIDQDMVWLDNGEVGRWRSTNGDIQLMRSGFEGIDSVDGGQFAELNSSSQAGLYRSLTVAPGTIIEWEFLHRARRGSNQLEIRIESRLGEEVVDTKRATTQWASHRGQWRVPDGVTSVRFMLWSNESGAYGNLIDAVRVVANPA